MALLPSIFGQDTDLERAPFAFGWFKNLREATFRGVPFLVDGSDGTFGRRNVQHIFPQKNDPRVEDLGRAPRIIGLTGFLLGDDYMEQRDKLQAACETEGPGILIHPYFGELKANCDSLEIRETDREGRIARLVLKFVQVEDRDAVVYKKDTSKKAAFSARAMLNQTKNTFARVLNAIKEINEVTDAISNRMGSIVSAAFTLKKQARRALDFKEKFDAITAKLETLQALILTDPNIIEDIADDFGAMMEATYVVPDAALDIETEPTSEDDQDTVVTDEEQELIDQNAIVGETSGDWETIGAVLKEKQLGENLEMTGIKDTLDATDSQDTADRFEDTISDNVVEAEQACENFAQEVAVGVAALQASETVFDSDVAAQASLDIMIDAIDEISEELDDDDLYDRVLNLRGDISREIGDRGLQAGRITELTLDQTLPSLRIEYDLYEELEGDKSIADRNKALVEHPGFVPGGVQLEIIARE